MAKAKTGLFRFEAIVPTVILFALIGGYFHFLFDHNIRWAAQWMGTRVHGAEVNIGKIKSSVFGGYLHVYNVQVTDKSNPKQNLIQVGSVKFELLWDALLRAKFVVNHASIENISIFSPRKRAGYIVPASDEGSKALRTAEQAVLDQSKEKFNSNVLGDVAHILGGVDPSSQLKNIEGELSSKKKIKEIEDNLKAKQTYWKKRIDGLPNKKNLAELEGRFKKLKFNTKKPLEFIRDLKELDKILKSADAQIKLVKTTAQDLDKDLKKINSDIKSIDGYVQQDIKGLEKRLKIPSLDIKDFSKDIFGKLFNDKLAPYKKYLDLAQTYMPPKKDPNKKTEALLIAPKKRFTGKTFKYPITVSYPVFWLKVAKISSKATEKGFSGNVEGVMTDLTSNPVYLKKPTLINFKADFPAQRVLGITSKIIIDHTTSKPFEKITGQVKSFEVGRVILTDSDSLKFYLDKSVGSSRFNGLFREGLFNVNIHNNFNRVDYLIKSNNKDVEQIFKAAVKDVRLINLKANASGKWADIKWNISSNLGDVLRDGIKKQIQARIDAARAKIKAQIEVLIGKHRKELESQYKKIKTDADKQIGAVKSDLEKSKKSIQSKGNSAKTQAKAAENKEKKKVKKKLEKEGQKILNDLKKKFKF